MSEIENLTPRTVVPFLADIFARWGDKEYLGEPVTTSQHMLQGAHFAEQRGEDEKIIVAALLHDIGHFTTELGFYTENDTVDRRHEVAGAAVLEPFFPEAVTACVRHHVAAKRYLCAVDPMYFGQLSKASVHSLGLQGGPMEPAEAGTFESNPHFDAIVKVRKLDDEGKVAGLETPLFAHFAPMVQRIVDAHCNEAAS